MYCLAAACEKLKYKAFYCGRHGKSKNFPEKYWMIDHVKSFGVVHQEASDVGALILFFYPFPVLEDSSLYLPIEAPGITSVSVHCVRFHINNNNCRERKK